VKRVAVVSVLGAVAVAAGAAFVLTRPEAAPVEASVEAPHAPAPLAAEPPTLDAARLRTASWIAAASGESPEFNQVSIEQDLGLVADVLAPPGYVLFAAGAGQPTVQVLAEEPRGDPMVDTLADLFAPRGGRDSSYRAPAITVDAPATAANVAEAIRIAVAEPGPPLLLWLAGHGHQGESPAQNTVGYWAQSSLQVIDFAEQLQRARRTVRVVATTCFSGGLAELVFADADASKGAAAVVTCGLFAVPWDLEASGCDPNPDRAAQEGYAIHFVEALRRRDRDGHELAAEAIDFDGDGAVSLLEAHARVRIASRAPDVPTTTSERWLEAVVPEPPPGDPGDTFAEEDAVVEALGAALNVAGREGEAVARLDALEDEIERVGKRLARAQDAEDRAFRLAAADVLARWPVLDDPWHPDFGATLSQHHAAIAAHLEGSEIYAAYVEAKTNVDALANAMADLRVEAAPLERLVRALESRRRAARLRSLGGPDLARYEALLACERWIPQLSR
jgi:hypothetical protein